MREGDVMDDEDLLKQMTDPYSAGECGCCDEAAERIKALKAEVAEWRSVALDFRRIVEKYYVKGIVDIVDGKLWVGVDGKLHAEICKALRVKHTAPPEPSSE
jgi:hypothetical protein